VIPNQQHINICDKSYPGVRMVIKTTKMKTHNSSSIVKAHNISYKMETHSISLEITRKRHATIQR